MESGLISRRYARTLMMYGLKHDQIEQIYESTMVLAARYLQLPALRRALSNKMLGDDKKLELIRVSSGGDVPEEFVRFARLLIANHRQVHIYTICLSFQEMVRANLRLLDATLTTAVEVDEGTLSKLKAELERYTDASVTLHTRVNPKIIGGYLLGWDTYRLDASVRGKLRRIREGLTQ